LSTDGDDIDGHGNAETNAVLNNICLNTLN